MNGRDGWGQRLSLCGGLVCASLVMGLPFFWMVLTSLKSAQEIAQVPPSWWPAAVRWENYTAAWAAAPFPRFYFNSFVVACAGTVLQLGAALLMSYAFAIIRFPGKTYLLIAVLATMIVPDEMKLVPNFMLLRRLDWIDTYVGLIVPGIAHAFPVFVLHQQFRQLPAALIDAAKVDGAGHGHILLQIAIPMSRPVLTATALVALLGHWNAYLWPLVITNTSAMRTLPLGLAYLRKQAEEGSTPWNLLMAAAVFSVVPVIILYVFAQKQFVEGIMRGALKG